jgi:hypothetical protein
VAIKANVLILRCLASKLFSLVEPTIPLKVAAANNASAAKAK